MKNNKLISIIIPTYNCQDLLTKTLESLCQLQSDLETIEVIVADDGSSDNTEVLVKSFTDRLHIRYCYQDDLGFRAAKARNMALAIATGKYTFFFDSGVVLKANALQVHLQAIKNNPSQINIGFCMGFEEHFVAKNDFLNAIEQHNFASLFNELTQSDLHLDCRQQLLNEIGHKRGFETFPWLFCWGGHLFAETQLFRQVGGFDEDFTHWGGEDVEFGLRLYKQGLSFELILDAYAYHIPHTKAETAGDEATVNNCHYIHDKHQLPITQRMLAETWEDIVRTVV